ncbi:MAG TPA: 50S ribosomal protein L37e [Nanoarchaeota archaeon]|nr:50S ribosomal protein L37e [Nanoarchaeota archaeon]
MSKGTPSKGKRSGKRNHIPCRRCGKSSYHMQKKRCSHCGYPDAKLRKYSWLQKPYGKR